MKPFNTGLCKPYEVHYTVIEFQTSSAWAHLEFNLGGGGGGAGGAAGGGVGGAVKRWK
jgi:uncharacterized membrane protein